MVAVSTGMSVLDVSLNYRTCLGTTDPAFSHAWISAEPAGNGGQQCFAIRQLFYKPSMDTCLPSKSLLVSSKEATHRGAHTNGKCNLCLPPSTCCECSCGVLCALSCRLQRRSGDRLPQHCVLCARLYDKEKAVERWGEMGC